MYSVEYDINTTTPAKNRNKKLFTDSSFMMVEYFSALIDTFHKRGIICFDYVLLHGKCDGLRTIPRRRFGQRWDGWQRWHAHKHISRCFCGKAVRLELPMVVGVPARAMSTLRAAVVTPAVVLAGTISKFTVKAHVCVWFERGCYFVRHIWRQKIKSGEVAKSSFADSYRGKKT
jgi:hypothetical protein